MTDEKFMFIQDSKEKKSVAASAFRTRTHCGKGGPVKFPSDFMTRKELNAMNGECKTYTMRDPLTWEQFKALPDDLKVEYVKWVREEFNIPDIAFTEVFGIAQPTLYKWLRTLGLSRGKNSSSSHKMWNYSDDRDRFLAWLNQEKNKEEREEEVSVETPEDISEDISEAARKEYEDKVTGENLETCMSSTEACSKVVLHQGGGIQVVSAPNMPVCPDSGSLTFERVYTYDALQTIRTILTNARCKIHISWEYYPEGETEFDKTSR